MVKIAKCGYGTEGKGGLKHNPDGYAYLVDDSVRVNSNIQVISTRYGNTKITKFVTTAKPFSIYKENTAKGKELRTEAEEKSRDGIEKGYTGAQAGATGSRAKTLEPLPGQKAQSEYIMQTRAKAVQEYKQEYPSDKFSANAEKTYETFGDYVKKFKNKGD